MESAVITYIYCRNH